MSIGLYHSELTHTVAGFSLKHGASEGEDPFLAKCGGAKEGIDVLLRQDHIIAVIRFVGDIVFVEEN